MRSCRRKRGAQLRRAEEARAAVRHAARSRRPEPVERAAYDAAYKGVTDVLTLYLWRKPAFYLTRWAARAGIAPNFVTLVGGILCVLAFFLFWRGEYWWGIAVGLRLHGARHGRREAGAGDRRLVEVGRSVRPRHRPRPPALLVLGVAARAGSLRASARTDRRDHGAVDDRRRLCRTAGDRGHLHQAPRARNPRVAADRQQVPADHRAAQPEHGDPFRRLAVPPARPRHRAGRLVDALRSLIFHAVRLAQASERLGRGEKIVSWLEA